MITSRINGLGQAVLLLSGTYHLVMGLFGLISVPWGRRAMKFLYSLKIPAELDPRYEYTWKMIGAFAVFTASLCFFASVSGDSIFQVFLVRALAGLFTLRAMMRWIYRDLFRKAYQVDLKRNLVNIAFNLAISAAILLFATSPV